MAQITDLFCMKGYSHWIANEKQKNAKNVYVESFSDFSMSVFISMYETYLVFQYAIRKLMCNDKLFGLSFTQLKLYLNDNKTQ